MTCKWIHSNGSVYSIQPAAKKIQLHRDHNIIESLTQVHRMNFILECNVIQVMAFRRVKVEVEACLGTILIGPCVYIIDIVDDVPCFPVAFNALSTVHVL